MKVEDKLFKDRFNAHDIPHITVDQSKCQDCELKPCIKICPAEVFKWEGEKLVVSSEGCLEIGACEVVCPYDAIEWNYPPGGYGIMYRYG